jgi:hypothetical protein
MISAKALTSKMSCGLKELLCWGLLQQSSNLGALAWLRKN